MSLFDDSFDTKIGGKKSSMFAYMENNQEEDTDVEDVDLSEEEEKVETEAALADLNRNSISSYKFSPALEACDEEMEYLCMEHVNVLATMESIDAQACEAYNNASSESEQQAVVEGFKESVSRYWERFKAFCVKIKNLIVRTIQRVIGYLKTLFTRIAAKIVAKMRGKDAKKMANEVKANKRFVSKVETYEKLLTTTTLDALFTKVETGNYTFDIDSLVNTAKNAINAAKTTEDKLDDYKDGLESKYDKESKTKSEIIATVLGAEEPKDMDISSYHDKIDTFVSDLKKAKIPKTIENKKKAIIKGIETVEKLATKSKNISSKRMSVLTFVMNKEVQQLNAWLAAIQQLCVMWLQARIKVVNKFYNASEDKDENDDDEKKSDDKKTDDKKQTTESLMDFYLSL